MTFKVTEAAIESGEKIEYLDPEKEPSRFHKIMKELNEATTPEQRQALKDAGDLRKLEAKHWLAQFADEKTEAGRFLPIPDWMWKQMTEERRLELEAKGWTWEPDGWAYYRPENRPEGKHPEVTRRFYRKTEARWFASFGVHLGYDCSVALAKTTKGQLITLTVAWRQLIRAFRQGWKKGRNPNS